MVPNPQWVQQELARFRALIESNFPRQTGFMRKAHLRLDTRGRLHMVTRREVIADQPVAFTKWVGEIKDGKTVFYAYNG